MPGSVRWVTQAFTLQAVLAATFNQYEKQDLIKFREEVRAMFQHAYDSYLRHAYPYDELRPLSCDGVDTWGSYSLTLVDALDTLAVMGNYTEFSRVYNLVAERSNFDANINVSVFETNIRIVGGLLSAHLMARRAGVQLEKGWPCSGPLLRLAEDAAQRLLPAFDTPTGMPYGTVNLRTGVPEGETPVTCTAGITTYIVEFGALSRLTGNPVYEEAALRALRSIWRHQSALGLPGNHIDVLTGKWTAVEAGIGAGVDSYYEYLVKGAALLQRPELMHMFNRGREAVDQYLKKDDWYFWVNMKNGQVTMPVFQSLEAFWPGVLTLVGDTEAALKSLHNYNQVWRQFGFTPEFYNVAQGGVAANREGYPLRPEMIESIMYLYRATGDPWLIDAGLDILRSIQHSAYTPCGYATVKNVKTHTLEDRMESFFLAETTKYLYLLFDPDNFIHNPGTHADIYETEDGGRCILDAGGYIFNSEAHPIDPAALACCSGLSEKEVKDQIATHIIDIFQPQTVRDFRGDLVPERIKKIKDKLKLDLQEKREKERKMREQMEELRLKAEQESEQSRRKQAEKQDKLRSQEEKIRQLDVKEKIHQDGEKIFIVEGISQKSDDRVEDLRNNTRSPAADEQMDDRPEEQHQDVDPVKADQRLRHQVDAEALNLHLSEGQPAEVQLGLELAASGQHGMKQHTATEGQHGLYLDAGRQHELEQPVAPRQHEKHAKEHEQQQGGQEAGHAADEHGKEELYSGGQAEENGLEQAVSMKQPAAELSGSPSGPAADANGQTVEGSQQASPEFAQQKETNTLEASGGYVTDMLQKLSRGDFLATAHEGGIIQPAKMPNLFERRANLVIETLSNLMGRFLPTTSYEFSIEDFTEKLQRSSQPVNLSWVADWSVMNCPAQKFTDRFLIHGEFFNP